MENIAIHTLLNLNKTEKNAEKIRIRAKVINAYKLDVSRLKYTYEVKTFSSPMLPRKYPVHMIRFSEYTTPFIVNFKMLIASFQVRQGNVSRLLKDYRSPEEKVIYHQELWLTKSGLVRFLDGYCEKIDKVKSYVLFGPHAMDFIQFMHTLIDE